MNTTSEQWENYETITSYFCKRVRYQGPLKTSYHTAG
jgi:hypothetical protein